MPDLCCRLHTTQHKDCSNELAQFSVWYVHYCLAVANFTFSIVHRSDPESTTQRLKLAYSPYTTLTLSIDEGCRIGPQPRRKTIAIPATSGINVLYPHVGVCRSFRNCIHGASCLRSYSTPFRWAQWTGDIFNIFDEMNHDAIPESVWWALHIVRRCGLSPHRDV